MGIVLWSRHSVLRGLSTHMACTSTTPPVPESRLSHVCTEVGYHVKAAMKGGELPTFEWLQDVPQDALVVACDVNLGNV
eukprot:SAG22_NODE_7641_length_721_cov_1.078778_2_plen_78_part_01